jgi:hypothetical protein
MAAACTAAIHCGGKENGFNGESSGTTQALPNGPLTVTTPGSSGAAASSGNAGPGHSGGVAQDCPQGGSTSISGVVYDPSFQDPLYNVTVYVPVSATLPALPSGASCSTCSSLYPPILASAVTDATGHFTIPDAPWGANVPIVVQTGKWRMQYKLPSVAQCKDNPLPDKTLRFPRNASEGNLPDIAISTGGADSLECLPLRIGIDASEYAAGGAGPGHLHVFTGAKGASTMPASPESYTALWDSTTDLLKYDVVILSCEGAETAHVTDGDRQSLSDYASAGGRVFASHFHYSWFNEGVFAADNLAAWTRGAQAVDPNDSQSFPGDVITTLFSGQAFPEGQALAQWLGVVGALTNGKLPIWFARHNADVTAANTASQPWIALEPTAPTPNATEYFSFDTPIGKAPACGRVVYSDLHVSGGPATNAPGVPPDYPEMPGVGGRFPTMGMNGKAGIVPSGCASHPLTPQEKALEFMLFDLSSCLIPVGQVATPAASPTPR